MDIANARMTICTQPLITRSVFQSEDDKNRASKIVEQLKGMSIREAQQFLLKVSEALIDAQTL